MIRQSCLDLSCLENKSLSFFHLLYPIKTNPSNLFVTNIGFRKFRGFSTNVSVSSLPAVSNNPDVLGKRSVGRLRRTCQDGLFGFKCCQEMLGFQTFVISLSCFKRNIDFPDVPANEVSSACLTCWNIIVSEANETSDACLPDRTFLASLLLSFPSHHQGEPNQQLQASCNRFALLICLGLRSTSFRASIKLSVRISDLECCFERFCSGIQLETNFQEAFQAIKLRNLIKTVIITKFPSEKFPSFLHFFSKKF